MIQVNRIYLIFNPAHFCVDGSEVVFKKVRNIQPCHFLVGVKYKHQYNMK